MDHIYFLNLRKILDTTIEMFPYINQGMIERITYLQTGDALVFGTAINLPTLTKFPEANPKPDSENAKISEEWYIEQLEDNET